MSSSRFTKTLFTAMAWLAVSAAAQVASHAPAVQVNAAPARSSVMATSGKIVARVNGAELTDRDLVRQMMNIFPYAKQHGGKFPKEMQDGIREKALDDIVFEELVYQEAKRRGMSVPPEKLNRAVAQFKKQFPGPAEYQAYLKQDMGGNLNTLKKKISRAILIDQLLTAETTRKAVLTDAKLREIYNRHPEKFTRPDSAAIQTISLVIPDNATAQQRAEIRKKAEELAKQARAAKDYEEFGMLAEKNSQDDWRVMMGDHKLLHRGQMPGPVEKAVFTMNAGQVSDVIEAENSFCIVRVNRREDKKLLSFEEVKPDLKKDLKAGREEQLRKNLQAQLRKKAKVEVL